MEMYLAVVGAGLGIGVTLYELFNKLYPYFQNKCPRVLGITSEYNDDILQKLRIEQCYKTKWFGLRTIVGLYEDIELFLLQNNRKLGCCCCKRPLNLTEFYHIISDSFEWRKMTDYKIECKRERKRILDRIELKDPNVSSELKNDIITYYWTLHKKKEKD